MGLFDRLFGKKGVKGPRRENPPHADSASDKTSTFDKDHPQAFSKQPAEPPKKTVSADTAASVVSSAVASEPLPPEPVSTEGTSDAPAAEHTVPPESSLTGLVAAAEPIAEAERPLSLSSEPASVCPAGSWEPRVQKRLDTYFARLRELYPDGEIVRLNTGHKKLAERGAELRRLTGLEGQLDAFFALGGFTYRRSAGGRPPLPAEQTEHMEERLRERFPEEVPTVIAVRDADHRLYLDLRAAARKAGMTVGDYLRQFQSTEELE